VIALCCSLIYHCVFLLSLSSLSLGRPRCSCLMQMQTQQRAQHAASSTTARSIAYALLLHRTPLLALAPRLLFCQLLLRGVLFVSQPKQINQKKRKLVVPAHCRCAGKNKFRKLTKNKTRKRKRGNCVVLRGLGGSARGLHGGLDIRIHYGHEVLSGEWHSPFGAPAP
jgi:hypothetical protein